MRSISIKLDNKLKDEFISVNKEKNPFFSKIKSITLDQKLEVIKQYSLFPKNIISMLVNAAYLLSYHNWDKAVEEIIQNINEELGEGKGKITKNYQPHYTVLRKVVQESFNENINKVIPNSSTNNFIREVKKVLSSEQPEIVAGGVYALESSAVPELFSLKELVISAAEDKSKTISQTFLDFFDWHVDDIEVEHRDRFLHVISVYIKTDQQWTAFEEGFNRIMKIMDNWWINLSNEIIE